MVDLQDAAMRASLLAAVFIQSSAKSSADGQLSFCAAVASVWELVDRVTVSFYLQIPFPSEGESSKDT